MRRKITIISIILLCLACATPVAPTGGEPDRESPELIDTKPESGTINFTGDRFEFIFNEYINRSSVPSEISIDPDIGLEYSLDWKRKSLTIDFDEELPDSTTIILTLGTGISDTRGNKLNEPITLAVSTGDEIDEAIITGNIRNAGTGKAVGGQKVFLFRSPSDFSKRANYQAETDTSGQFTFNYIAEGRYRVLSFDDRNRNKKWDRSNERAYPFYTEFVNIESNEDSVSLDMMYVQRMDTLRPSILGIGVLTGERLRLRFSENILFSTDGTSITLTDTTNTVVSEAYPLYISPADSTVLFVHSESNLQENERYRIQIEGITDKAGNELMTYERLFTGSAQADTVRQRVVSEDLNPVLTERETMKITYAKPISEDIIRDSLVVIEGNLSFTDWPEVSVMRNELIIGPQEKWIEGVEYQFLAWNPETNRRVIFTPEIYDSTEFGDIEVVITNADSTSSYVVEIYKGNSAPVLKRSFNQQTIIEGVIPGSYLLRIFEDENGNGEWDLGEADPYRKPERIFVQRNVEVQSLFTSVVNLTF